MGRATLDDLKTLVTSDRRFRADLGQKAANIFRELRESANGIVDILGAADSDYPLAVEDISDRHFVAVLGPRVIHVSMAAEAAVPKYVAFVDDKTHTAEFDRLATTPDHENSALFARAIEFTRASSRAYRERIPGTVPVFAVMYVGRNDCEVESPSLLAVQGGNWPRLGNTDVQNWATKLLTELFYVGLVSGVSTFRGVRMQSYDHLLAFASDEPHRRSLGFELPNDFPPKDGPG